MKRRSLQNPKILKVKVNQKMSLTLKWKWSQQMIVFWKAWMMMMMNLMKPKAMVILPAQVKSKYGCCCVICVDLRTAKSVMCYQEMVPFALKFTVQSVISF